MEGLEGLSYTYWSPCIVQYFAGYKGNDPQIGSNLRFLGTEGNNVNHTLYHFSLMRKVKFCYMVSWAYRRTYCDLSIFNTQCCSCIKHNLTNLINAFDSGKMSKTRARQGGAPPPLPLGI